MFAFLYFISVWKNISDNCQNKILSNIFCVNNISSSSVVVIGKNKIIFRMYISGVFYQYSYIDGVGDNFEKRENKIVERVIFIKNIKIGDIGDVFIYYLVRCVDEFDVYRLLQKFL